MCVFFFLFSIMNLYHKSHRFDFFVSSVQTRHLQLQIGKKGQKWKNSELFSFLQLHRTFFFKIFDVHEIRHLSHNSSSLIIIIMALFAFQHFTCKQFYARILGILGMGRGVFLQQELSDLKGGRYFTYYSRMYSVRKLSSVPSSRNFLHLNLMHHFEFIFLLSWPLFVWHSVQLFTFFCPNMFHMRLRKFGKSSSKMSYENNLGQNRHCAQQLGLVFKARTYSTYIQILRQKGGTRWIIQPNIFCWGA